MKILINSSKLKELLKKIKQIKYSEQLNSLSTFNSKIHEESIEKIIIESGFKKLKTLNMEIDNYYVYQPYGSQKPPDFIVFHNNESIELECKSTKNSYKPMWNCSYPKKSCLYIHTNKNDKTLIIPGNKIITPKLEELLIKYKNENKLLHDKWSKELNNLSKEDNPYTIDVYPRNMFIQKKNFNIKDDIENDLQ